MQIIPQSVLLNTAQSHTQKASTQTRSYHNVRTAKNHGDGVLSPLLAIPSESLTHVTAFLDPTSLFAVARTCKLLHEHVNDDDTWHKAFNCQFLGERPDLEEDPSYEQGLLLRRTEESWKREFVYRWNLLRCVTYSSSELHFETVIS